jgi:hypothetical protein
MTNFAVDKERESRIFPIFCFGRHLKGLPVDLRERFSFITTPEQTQISERKEQKKGFEPQKRECHVKSFVERLGAK